MTRADLLRYDPRPTQRGEHERFLCPQCGDEHAHDQMHQSLSLRGGHYLCHRCGYRGVLEEYVHPASRVRRLSPREALKDRFKV